MLRRILRRRKAKITSVTGNLVRGDHGRYAAYFDEFPELIAEGENSKEAKENLIEALKELLEYRKAISKKQAESAGKQKVDHFQLEIA